MRTLILLLAAFAFTACADSTPMDQTTAPKAAVEVNTPESTPLSQKRCRHVTSTGTLQRHWLFLASNPV
jgi:hypothetical protein